MKSRINSNRMLIICGHGSKDVNFQKSFINFVKKIRQSFPNLNVDFCYIEINKPLIEFSIKNYADNFKNIIFLPALIFKGKHLKIDIKAKVRILSEKFNANISFIDNIELGQDILSIYKRKISREIVEKDKTALITCSSFSKHKDLNETLKKYTKKLAHKMKVLYFESFQFNDGKTVVEKLELAVKDNKINKIILHPIFLFDGFLYKEVIKNFEKNFKNIIHITRPLLEETEVFSIFRKKISDKIGLL